MVAALLDVHSSSGPCISTGVDHDGLYRQNLGFTQDRGIFQSMTSSVLPLLPPAVSTSVMDFSEFKLQLFTHRFRVELLDGHMVDLDEQNAAHIESAGI